jgi:malonyl-CoA O-methyltransferase
VNRFIDMHDLGDALVHASFADPVMEMEMITLEYATVDAVARD